MLATEVHEKFYLNVTKFTAIAGAPPRLRGFEVDAPRCRQHARGWAVPSRQVRCDGGGPICRSAPACPAAGLEFVPLCASKRRGPPLEVGGKGWDLSYRLASPFPPLVSPCLSVVFFTYPPPNLLKGEFPRFSSNLLKGLPSQGASFTQGKRQRRQSVWR